MNAILFFIIFVLVLSAGYGYVGVRFILPMQLPAPWNSVAWSFLIALLVIPAGMMFLSFNRLEGVWSTASSWIAYVSLGLFSFVFTLTLLKDLGWLGAGVIQKIGTLLSSSDTADAFDPERRRLMVRGVHLAILGTAGSLTAYGIYDARRRPGIVNITIPLVNLPPGFDGFRIVQISDIHAGLTVTRPFVETVVTMAQELKGDLIAFTGDLVDGTVDHLRDHVEPMSHLSAPYGKFFITGNHEYYSGAEVWVKEARGLGFTTLINEHRIVERNGDKIILAGVTDVSGGDFYPHHRSDPAKAYDGAPAGLTRILLAHQPRSLAAAMAAGTDLMLSGHTHGGQFFPWNLVASLGQPLLKGLKKFDKTWVYVTKGSGYWGPPVRLGARSEITVITLKRQLA